MPDRKSPYNVIIWIKISLNTSKYMNQHNHGWRTIRTVHVHVVLTFSHCQQELELHYHWHYSSSHQQPSTNSIEPQHAVVQTHQSTDHRDIYWNPAPWVKNMKKNKSQYFKSSYHSYQRFDMQVRQKGQFCFVLILSPRLCAFLNKGIFDSRLNSNNSYCYINFLH